MISPTDKSRTVFYALAGIATLSTLLIIQHTQFTQSADAIILVVAVILSLLLVFKSIDSKNNSPKNSIEELDKKNIRLALNFQGLGKLDAAYALYKQCKPSDKIVALLSNLAQDYEIIQQDHNAKKIYSYILSIQPNHSIAQKKAPQAKKKRKSTPFVNTPDESSTLFNGRYEIDKSLGKGTGSSIFLAKDYENDKQSVALKILEINYDEKNVLETELLARFMREAETAASLTHKNIVKIIDSGHANNVAFIVMEHVKGRSLQEYSKPGNLLPPALVIDLIAQCAEGLHYAHEKGIIHRDVKPANILYDHAASTAKLGDFGIAHIANSTQTLAGSFLGTPFYMSPEQLNSLNVDARSDIFSLGATLYRLLTGVPPFSGKSMAHLMQTIVNTPHQNILDIRPDLPKTLVDVVEIALAKNPDDRFSDALAFSKQLRNCQLT